MLYHNLLEASCYLWISAAETQDKDDLDQGVGFRVQEIVLICIYVTTGCSLEGVYTRVAAN